MRLKDTDTQTQIEINMRKNTKLGGREEGDEGVQSPSALEAK